MKKHCKEPRKKTVVRRRRWSGRNARGRGHAKRRLLVKRRGQESIQGLAMLKQKMRHITRKGNGLVRPNRAFTFTAI